MTFDYSQDKDEAARLAREALPLVNKYNLPANPVNFTVFYEYVSGRNEALTAAMDSHLSAGKPITTEDMTALFSAYVKVSEDDVSDRLRDALSTMLETARHSLTRMDGNSQEFESQLSVAVRELSDSAPDLNVMGVVERLVQETEQMRQASQTLRSELDQARAELADLRSEFIRVRQESLVDALTGVKNRRAFDAALQDGCTAARNSKSSLCLLLIDIDHFKTINDTHGHMAGDSVLKWFADLVRETVKGTDTVARYGGEEFSVLLPDTSLPGARIVAENIRNRVCEHKLRVGKAAVGTVTCSVGVAALSGEDSPETLISKADDALYKAKETGRNKVVVHGF